MYLKIIIITPYQVKCVTVPLHKNLLLKVVKLPMQVAADCDRSVDVGNVRLHNQQGLYPLAQMHYLSG